MSSAVSKYMILPKQISFVRLFQGVQSDWKSWKNAPFPEFGLKSWKTIGFPPAFAGKAGILFLGPLIINGVVRCKIILSRNRIKEEKIV